MIPRLLSLLFLVATIAGVARPALAAGRVTGRVVDVDSSGPIDGARVLLIDIESGESQVTQTDAEGRFTFAAVAAGRYRVQAMKPGLLTIAGVSVDATVAVTGDDAVSTRDLGLRRGGTVSGRVVNGDGIGLAGLFVQLEPLSAGGPSLFVAPVQTDEGGDFRVSGLAPGQFVVVARSRPGLAGESGASAGHLATYYPSAIDRARATPVTIAAGQTAEPLRIVMQTGALFVVSGIIIDEDGAAVPDITFTLTPTSDAGSAVVAHGSENGRFTIRGVQPGTYHLVPSRDAQEPANTSGAAPVRPTSPPGSEITITVDNADLSGLTVVMGARPRLVSPH